MPACTVDMSAAMVSSPSLPCLGPVTDPDEMLKKIRKPYTITKSRESWTDQEHDKFLEALQLFDRDWKKIEAFVGSKTVIQIRSHAQKYFLKVQKNGTGEHVPPPRPKRKSALPYPQKAAKSALVQQQLTGVSMYSTIPPDCDYGTGGDLCAVFGPSLLLTPPASSWVHHSAHSNHVDSTEKASRGYCSSSDDSSPANLSLHRLPSSDTNDDPHVESKATPDFAEIYNYLGAIFDPSMSGHLEKLKEMVPIDRETILLLMRNLSINLSGPELEEPELQLQMS